MDVTVCRVPRARDARAALDVDDEGMAFLACAADQFQLARARRPRSLSWWSVTRCRRAVFRLARREDPALKQAVAVGWPGAEWLEVAP